MDRVIIRGSGRANEIGYHVSPSKNTGDILQKGLKDPAYIWKSKGNAEWFRRLHEDPDNNEYPEDMTIWIVDITGLNMEADEETKDMSYWSSAFREGEFGEGYIYRGRIPPERLVDRY